MNYEQKGGRMQGAKKTREEVAGAAEVKPVALYPEPEPWTL